MPCYSMSAAAYRQVPNLQGRFDEKEYSSKVFPVPGDSIFEAETVQKMVILEWRSCIEFTARCLSGAHVCNKIA